MTELEDRFEQTVEAALTAALAPIARDLDEEERALDAGNRVNDRMQQALELLRRHVSSGCLQLRRQIQQGRTGLSDCACLQRCTQCYIEMQFNLRQQDVQY